MEDVLEVYSRPYDESYPIVCMDEKPVQFFADFRTGFRSKKNGVVYEDYQYIRMVQRVSFSLPSPWPDGDMLMLRNGEHSRTVPGKLNGC